MLSARCDIIVTDSGGIQKEAAAPVIQKPVLVIRLLTERSEAVAAGFAEVGVRSKSLLSAMRHTLDRQHEISTRSPYGDGRAAGRIVDLLVREGVSANYLGRTHSFAFMCGSACQKILTREFGSLLAEALFLIFFYS